MEMRRSQESGVGAQASRHPFSDLTGTKLKSHWEEDGRARERETEASHGVQGISTVLGVRVRKPETERWERDSQVCWCLR